MIPDWKLEKYLTGDLPASEMNEIRELENSDEIFAARVKMFREDNESILRKMPFGNLSARLSAMPSQHSVNGFGSFKNSHYFKFNALKIAAMVVFMFGVFFAVVFNANNESTQTVNSSLTDLSKASNQNEMLALANNETDTRIKGMDVRMEVWKKTGDGIIQMENLGDASEGDEIQLRYSVPQKCFGLLFSMDGNGIITMHLGNNENSIALEPGKMITLPFAYKLDNAPNFEKFFLLTSKNEFTINSNDIDASLKQKGVQVTSLTLRKVIGGK